MKIIIGIAAKNEESSIYKCLLSLAKAIEYGKISAKTVVCVNGSTDRTGSIVSQFMKEFPLMDIELIELEAGNLIKAQRLIVGYCSSDFYIFLDADTTISKTSLAKMIANMSVNMLRDGYVNYAKTRLTPPLGKESYVTRLYRLYSSGGLLTHRYYFHGRFFAIRGWYVPTDREVANIQNKKNKLSQFGGLNVDDIFLSTYILKKYGPDAINELKDVYVYAKPITSLRDWYYTYRRTDIEIKKILLL
ncbi:glycosyltransferase, partial [Candidatus Saccharibacteria bacterium]|nr:glycosyltransferase [Candidatus Saccharibacteria bacterium]